MSGKPASQAAMHKPCLCRVFPRARWLWRPTGGMNAQHRAEYKCRLCGAISWEQSEAALPAGELGGE
jgi:hypothetical protein